MYLYDDNLFNDVSYWLNRSVLGSFLPRCLKAWGQKQDDSIRDRMYNWAGRDDYGPIALYTASFTPPENPLPADARTQLAQENLNAHLIAYITAPPGNAVRYLLSAVFRRGMGDHAEQGNVGSDARAARPLLRRAERLRQRDDL